MPNNNDDKSRMGADPTAHICERLFHNHVKKIVAVHDLSGVGRVSLMAVIPILSTMGFQVCPLPTAILSTHTQYPVYSFLDLTDEMRRIICKWKQLGVRFDAFYSGYLGSPRQVQIVEDFIQKFRRPSDLVVVDPVMVSTSGCALMQPDALAVMKEQLLSMADLVTPNLPEAWTLAGTETSVDDAAQSILRLGVKALLIKGGHAEGKAKTDYLYIYKGGGVKRVELSAETVDTVNTHGTGCTLSSAIAAFAALGCGLEEAVRRAKDYLTEALKAGKDVRVGGGHGPVCHFVKPTSRQAYEPTSLLKIVADDLTNHIVSSSAGDLSAVRLQFITHFTEKYSYLDSAMMALEGGCRWIQLRMKDAGEAEIERVARLVLPECRRRGAVFVIDDHVELALRVGADGVHLGKNDMPVDEARRMAGEFFGKQAVSDKQSVASRQADERQGQSPCLLVSDCSSAENFIIGGTANTFEDVQRLAAQGADYIGCGPFRFTTTKKNLAPMLGIDGYRNILSQMKEHGIELPLVAIGGITSDDIPLLMAAGVSGIALSGSILRAESPVEEMKKVIEKLRIES